jgi:hypothetical protein
VRVRDFERVRVCGFVRACAFGCRCGSERVCALVYFLARAITRVIELVSEQVQVR